MLLGFWLDLEVYSSFLFRLKKPFFSKVLNFLMTVALGMPDISAIEDAFIPLSHLNFNIDI